MTINLSDLVKPPACPPSDPVLYARDYLRRRLVHLILPRPHIPTLQFIDTFHPDPEASSPTDICRAALHDRLAWEKARLLALEHLHYGTTPPPELVDLALAYLAGEVTPPPKSRGRQRTGAWYAAVVIDNLLQGLVGLYGMKRYRNEAIEPNPRRYAIDCAAAALSLVTGDPWTADAVRSFLRNHLPRK